MGINQTMVAGEILRDEMIADAIRKFVEKNHIHRGLELTFVRNIVYVGIKFTLAGFGFDNVKTLLIGLLMDVCERDSAIRFARVIYSITNTYMEEHGI